MPAPITIVGLGLAGTLLGWELERHGAEFEIIAPPMGGDEEKRLPAASAVAAGIVNPITGQRIVKSWRVDELLPLAREAYGALERTWEVSVWRDLRIRRLWRTPEERDVFTAKHGRGELAPYDGDADAAGFWIKGAGHVDVPRLLAAARARWRRSGHLSERIFPSETPAASGQTIIWCTGAALRVTPGFSSIPWTIAKGETLDIAVNGLEPDLMLNRGHWLLPGNVGEAKVGATYAPGVDDDKPSAAARAELVRSVEGFTDQPFEVVKHLAGLRLTLTDKHPVVGRIPSSPNQGVMGGLGSKGVLLAPWLARQWWNHLSEGVPFDPAVDVARFARGV
jgi:glycine oxidase